MAPHPRVDVLGVGISAVDPEMALDDIAHWIETGERTYVCVTGVHGVMESQHDPALRRIHNASGLTVPDGMPLVWAGHRAGATWMRRVYGPDLMLAVLGRAAEEGWSSFLYGGGEGVPELLGERLVGRIPGLKIVGAYSPPYRPLTPDESADVVATINASGADLVWVGLSTPKQELWMAQHRGGLDARVLLGVGAAFDFHAGLMPQAPAWLQRHGLEWAYRLAKEPRRLWRRYLRNNPAYMARTALCPPRLHEPVSGECSLWKAASVPGRTGLSSAHRPARASTGARRSGSVRSGSLWSHVLVKAPEPAGSAVEAGCSPRTGVPVGPGADVDSGRIGA